MFDDTEYQDKIWRKNDLFTLFSFITKYSWTWLCNKVETRKDFRFYYLWLYFVYQNFQNRYFWISLFILFFELICGKCILNCAFLNNMKNWQIFVDRLENSDFILESKMVELNRNKNSKQPDWPDSVWKLYFTMEINE